MAKSRPALGGIFRLKGKNEHAVQLTSMNYGSSNASKPNSSTAVENHFTKSTLFGNYKPKILTLTEEENANKTGVTSSESSRRHNPEPAFPSTSGEGDKFTSRYSSNNDASLAKSASVENLDISSSLTKLNKRPSANVKKGLKTKSSKNFILMGDKDTPLEFGSNLDGDELPDELPGDSGQTNIEDTSSIMEQVLTLGDDQHDSEETIKSATGTPKSFADSPSEEPVYSTIIKEQTPHVEPKIHIRNNNNSITSEDEMTEKDMPYIPPPDYDEDSMTMDIADEDGADYVANHQDLTGRTVYRVFQGDDFGQYLHEEDSAFVNPTDRVKPRYKKSTPRSSKKTNKTPNKSKTLTGTLSKALFGSSKKSEQQDSEKRHTIHEFSYGHSKVGLGDSDGIPNGVWRTGGKTRPRGEPSRYNDDHRLSNYELFLQSRQADHKKSGSLESTSDSGNETGEDTSRNNESPGHFYTTSPAYYSPNKYVKRNGLWEKLTLRFRRRSEIGTVN